MIAATSVKPHSLSRESGRRERSGDDICFHRRLLLQSQGFLQARGEGRGGAFSPVVEEEVARLLHRHVMMDGNDVDALCPQRLEHGLQFSFGHSEIPIHQCVVIRPRKRRPGVYAHLLVHIAAARHLGRTTNDYFEHAPWPVP